MISILLHASEWIILLAQTVGSLLKCLFLTRRVSPILTKPTRELVILGNGPSLQYTLTADLEKLGAYDLMAVNLFACSDVFGQIRPTHYVWLDPAFAELDHPAGSKARLALVQHTTWPLTLWVPRSFQSKDWFFREISKNEYIKFQYFNYVICEGFPSITYSIFNSGWGMLQCQNVLIASIFLGIRAHYKKIWLTGADHTWHEDIRLNADNQLEVFDSHFYEKEKNITQLFQMKSSSTSYLSRAFLSLHKVYRGYEILAGYALSRGVIVHNASKKSYIDVFPKLPLA